MEYTTAQQHSKWIGRAMCFVVVLGVIILPIAFYFGPQTVTYYKLRPFLLRPADESPRGWSSVPQSLADTRLSTAPGTRLSYFGYSVEVPWAGVDREVNEGRWAEVHFKTGQVVRFVNPEIAYSEPINRHDVMNDKDFDLGFGSQVHGSKYQQFDDILSVKPSDLSPFHSHREFARIRVLLDIKGLWFEHYVAVPEIFSFETGLYRGFEISGLAHGWQNVGLHVFDERRNQLYFVGLNIDRDSNAKLDQSEINRIIGTFTVAHSPLPVEQPVGWDCPIGDACSGPTDVWGFFIFGMVLMTIVCSVIVWARTHVRQASAPDKLLPD